MTGSAAAARDPVAAKMAIRDRAAAEGFALCAFTEAAGEPAWSRDLQAYLADGRQGDMGWLAARAPMRADPRVLWPAARSVIVLGVSYAPADDPLAPSRQRDRGAISVYARGRDYHDVLKRRLRALAAWIAAEFATEVKLFVDTAPVMEKPLAARAGLGWQGKHTNLVSRRFGSWLFLGEVLTALALPADEAEADHCGACRRCLDACPTAALPAPYRIEPRRCVSYLTIEHKGPIDRALRPLMGNRVYGCDDCLAVCPWNKFATPAADRDLLPRAELTTPRLAELAALDDAAFRRLFAGTAIKRTGRDRFVRNVMIAIGNSGAPELAAAAERALDDASPLVRAMAVWALGRLAPGRLAALAPRRRGGETDPAVAAEWDAAPAAP